MEKVIKAVKKSYFVRYILVAAISKISLIVGTFFLVEYMFLSESLAYFFVISLVYIGVYFASISFVFGVESNGKRIGKYVIYLAISWVLANILYNLMISVFDIYYIIAVIINMIILMLFRFFAQKKFVFN